MYREIQDDLFVALKKEIELASQIHAPKPKILVPHVVNNQGAFGAGFVVPLGQIYPKCEEEYYTWSDGKLENQGEIIPFGLGETLFVDCDDCWVAHMCAQTLGGTRPLMYNHLVKCMEAVSRFSGFRIFCPKFGSGLAGGNWSFIHELIHDIWVWNQIDVTVFYL